MKVDLRSGGTEGCGSLRIPVADQTSIQLSDVAAPSATVTSVTLSGPALSPRQQILLYDSDE